MVASWLVIIGVIGLVYKFVVEPWIRGDLVKETSTQRYAHTIKIAHDSFPGVCDPTFSCRSEPFGSSRDQTDVC